MSVRRAGGGPLPLVEGAPEFLGEELKNWLRPLLVDDGFYSELRLRLRRGGNLMLLSGVQALDVVDAALYWWAQRHGFTLPDGTIVMAGVSPPYPHKGWRPS